MFAKRNKVSNERGFTLLELMTVVVIVGILATLAEPTFRQSVRRAKETALKQNLFALREGLDQYRADRGRYPVSLVDLRAAGYLKLIPIDPFTASDSTWQEMINPGEEGVFDAHSGSDLVAIDGTPYNQW